MYQSLSTGMPITAAQSQYMNSPDYKMGQAAQSALMARSASAGDYMLQDQQHQNRLGMMKNIFGNQNPWQAVQGLAGMGGDSSSSSSFGLNGGGGVFNPQQQQQLINAGVATNNQQLGSNLQGLQGALAGKGYSASSPLWSALTAGQQAQTAAQNADIRRQVPLEIAQANADNQLSTALGSEQIRSSRAGQGISMLNMLLGLV